MSTRKTPATKDHAYDDGPDTGQNDADVAGVFDVSLFDVPGRTRSVLVDEQCANHHATICHGPIYFEETDFHATAAGSTGRDSGIQGRAKRIQKEKG